MKYDIVKLMARRKIRWKKRWVSGDSGGRLTFRSKKAGRLSDYRIYGNTVDGNSVGDLVESGEHAGEYKVPVTVEGKNLFDGEIEQGGYDNYGLNVDNELRPYRVRGTNYIPVVGGETYNLHAVSISPLMYHISYYTKNDYTTQRFGYVGWTQNTVFTTPSDCKYIRLLFKTLEDRVITPDDISNIMLNAGSTALPYEPYHAPVTTPIYLPEQIKMVGDEAEYIDYAEQKMHRIGADDIDVTLPALPTLPGTNVPSTDDIDVILPALPTLPGTNVLSVGTEVQPSRVEVKGRIKAVGQETEPEPEAAEPEPEAAEAEPEAAEPEPEAAEAEPETAEPEQEAAEAEQEAAEPEQEEPEVKEDDTDDR